MRVLGIETSCDETGVAIYDGDKGLLAHELYSQVALHQQYGGVVPELAARDHVNKILPLIRQCCEQAKMVLSDLNAIAYTAGPGLMGALLTGAGVATSLAYSLDIPAIPIHHMEGHLQAALLTDEKPKYPFLVLLVSGGHSLLLSARAFGDYELLGESLDDAVGESFDKVAKLLGLPYPGGPAVAKLATIGDAKRFQFPRPLANRDSYDFSFSGLKTAVANTVNQLGDLSQQDKADVAASFQAAAIDCLMIKLKKVQVQRHYDAIVIAGGVSANQLLRQRLAELAVDTGCQVYFPPLDLCTDNGAMIAYTGYQCLVQQRVKPKDWQIHAKARWLLTALNS